MTGFVQAISRIGDVINAAAAAEQVVKEAAIRVQAVQDAAEADLKVVAEEKTALLHDVVALRDAAHCDAGGRGEGAGRDR